MNDKISHRELCILASKWLKKECRCTVAIFEPKGIKENPDAIGWRYSWGNASNEGSVLVECKTSRADFKKDFSKSFRIEPEQGIGNWRYYMCPTDIIKVDEIPDKWGLIYVNEKRKLKVIKHPYKDSLRGSKYNVINTENERYLLTRWLSKTEEPEKVMLMLRETNNKFNNLCKSYDIIKTENKNLLKFKRVLTNTGNDKINENTIDNINDEMSRLYNIEWYLSMYKETGEERYLKLALSKTKDEERKVCF